MVKGKTKGIIFDMDNTLLRSRIDFPALKQDIYQYLRRHRLLSEGFPIHEHTASTLIEFAKDKGISEEMLVRLYEIAARHEIAGMQDAGLESGVEELLEDLHPAYTLVVITNNSYAAALKALRSTKIIHYFDLIVGREQMKALKPSPSGFQFAAGKYPHILPREWLSVGDSWIDGKASGEAGIPFIGYGSGNENRIRSRGIKSEAHIRHIKDILNFIP